MRSMHMNALLVVPTRFDSKRPYSRKMPTGAAVADGSREFSFLWVSFLLFFFGHDLSVCCIVLIA